MSTIADEFFSSIKNKKVAFCGLGKSHIPTIKLFREKNIEVIACDASNESKLLSEISALKNLNVEIRLGKDCLKKLDMDIIFRTPGMKFEDTDLIEARKKGIVVTSEMEVFFDLCPCKIIGITGSDGKTTTSTLIYEMLKHSGKNVYLGGNIGTPLLPIIDSIKPSDFVVVELSSFQLISMRKSPDISVVTNLEPNHLDMHKDMNEYIDAKKNIILHQNAFSKTVLNLDNDITHRFSEFTRGDLNFFSRRKKVRRGTFVKDGKIYYSDGKNSIYIIKTSDIKIPGQHNVENYLASICAVFDYVSLEDIRFVAKNFSGVEHRIEFVRELNGVKYYNDSIASSPTRVTKGILSLFDKKIIMIAGGYDKKIPFDTLGPVIVKKVKNLILMGQTALKIENAVKNVSDFNGSNPKIIHVKNMHDAVYIAKKLAKEGDIVSLSPACASFDLYKNFDLRGKDFKNIVNSL